jgi:hypothetical protein
MASANVSGTEHFSSSSSSDPDPTTDVPVYLCLAAVVLDKLSAYFAVLKNTKGKILDNVEINVDYIIHRTCIGEWTMLILGESILSFLIVEVVAG